MPSLPPPHPHPTPSVALGQFLALSGQEEPHICCQGAKHPKEVSLRGQAWPGLGVQSAQSLPCKREALNVIFCTHKNSQVWRCTPVISVLGRQRQEDCRPDLGPPT